jgi:hypothetical protein
MAREGLNTLTGAADPDVGLAQRLTERLRRRDHEIEVLKIMVATRDQQIGNLQRTAREGS